MTDRELLEAAAKAAGIRLDKSSTSGGPAGNAGFDRAGNVVLDWHNGLTWNPLNRDSEALRLAVKLGMKLDFFFQDAGGDFGSKARAFQSANCSTTDYEPHGSDLYAATRRAIVRAAAALAGAGNEGERK